MRSIVRSERSPRARALSTHTSVIPISSVLFIIAQALVLPDVLREARGLKPAHVAADGLT